VRNRFAGWLQSRPLWQFVLVMAVISFVITFIASLGFWEVNGHSGEDPLDFSVTLTITMTGWQTWMRWNSSKDQRTGRRTIMMVGLIASVFLLAVGIYYAAIHHKGGVLVLVLGAALLLCFLVMVPVGRRRGKF
jgi:O-antigen/teichoic acid export membrane protein